MAQQNALTIEDGDDYSTTFRKKMSLPAAGKPHRRALSTLQNPSPVGPQVPRQGTADHMGKAAIRFKKVGNLLTREQEYPGARLSSLNKTMGPGNQNLFLKNIFNEQ